MVEIDEVHDHLKAIDKADWKVPAIHPDLVPVAEAGRLADLLRYAKDEPRSQAKPAEFVEWLANSSKLAEALEARLLAGGGSATELHDMFVRVSRTCTDCHVKYRT
jgi:hypothetical protein